VTEQNAMPLLNCFHRVFASLSPSDSSFLVRTRLSPQRPSIPRLNGPQNGDDTPIWYASEALMTLQRAYGLFPRIMGKGDAAKVILAWIQADLPFKVAVRTVIAKPPRAHPRFTLVAPHKSSR
jgi:hypothetical protein